MRWLLALILLTASNCYSADWYIVGKIVECESHGYPTRWGDNGLAYGLAQFHLPTFNWMKHKAHMPWLRRTRPADQLTLLRWALDNGYAYHWSCWRHHHREWERNRTKWILTHNVRF